jgi:hypothetical protein
MHPLFIHLSIIIMHPLFHPSIHEHKVLNFLSCTFSSIHLSSLCTHFFIHPSSSSWAELPSSRARSGGTPGVKIISGLVDLNVGLVIGRTAKIESRPRHRTQATKISLRRENRHGPDHPGPPGVI